MTIVLIDFSGRDTWRWIAEKAYPVKWSGGALDAASNTVLVESVEFAHHGITRG
jgi:phage tail-like protein